MGAADLEHKVPNDKGMFPLCLPHNDGSNKHYHTLCQPPC